LLVPWPHAAKNVAAVSHLARQSLVNGEPARFKTRRPSTS